MISALLNGLISFLFFIIKVIGTLLFYPLQLIFITIFPSVGEYTAIVLTFLRQNIFPTIGFLRNFLLKITYCPPALFNLIVLTFFSFLTAAISLRTYVLIIKIYGAIKGHGGDKN